MKIENFSKIKSFGFSLIEVMIAITIIGVVGVISVAIFAQTVKTSQLVVDTSNLKQNSESALNVMAETLRNAEAVVCYGSISPLGGPTKDVIVIRTIQGKYVKFRFVDPVIVSGLITKNGYIARQDNISTEGVSDFYTLCTSTQPSFENLITNDSLDSGVNVDTGSFTKVSANQNKDTIMISFIVNPSRTQVSGSTKSIKAETTVQIR